ncbi:MAG: HAD-IIIC family phosphatase [Phycisphaerae bacterium]
MTASPASVLVLGTSGLDLLAGPLRERLTAGGQSDAVEIEIAGYDQWRARLMNSTGPPPALVVIVLDGEDLFFPWMDRVVTDPAGAAGAIRDELSSDITATLSAGINNHPDAQFIVVAPAVPTSLVPGSLAAASHAAVSEAVEDLNRTLRAWAGETGRAHLIDTRTLFTRHGERTLRDRRLWALARCRWSREGLCLLADRVASLWRAIRGLTRKCLVLDLDNTLWGGVIGEAGATGIELGHEGLGLAYREFQMRLRRLRSLGVLLAINSKNDESLAWETIERHPAMILKRSDFAAWRINWSDKAQNLQEIAADLNISVAALVFVDDDEAEQDRVRTALPDVAVPEFPSEATALTDFADEFVWQYFNRTALTAEDLDKTRQYHDESRRDGLKKQCTTIEEWLASLEMRSRIVRADPSNLPRLTQLTQKTNQFNLTTRRYTQDQMADMAKRDDWIILCADLTDRVGDSGVVGLAMAHRTSDTDWRLDNFLLSCRVIGRTLEYTLLHAMACLVRDAAGRRLLAEYLPTERNQLVRDLWGRLGFTLAHEDPDGRTEWSCDLSTSLPEAGPLIRWTFAASQCHAEPGGVAGEPETEGGAGTGT